MSVQSIRSARAMKELRKCLRAIRDFETPSEIVYDKFTYERMVNSFSEAAQMGLWEAERVMKQKIDNNS